MQKFGLKLGLSIAEMLCCSPLFGLIALIMVIIENSKFKAGDDAESEKLSKIATILLIVGAVLSVVVLIIYVAIFGLSFASLGSSYSY